jgi:dTMP kinase
MSMIHPERPRLIVLEGIDLSGRTTQVQLLHDWLVAQRYQVTTTAWRTSPLISDVLARARAGPPLRPLTYSLLYAADQLDRTQCVIKPALQHGEIVLADRYIYTAFARDAARGLDSDWVHNLYRHAVQPDVVFYLHISPEEAVKRRFTFQQQRLDEQHKMAAKHGKGTKNEKAAKRDGRQKKVSSPLPASLLLTSEALENFRIFELKMYSEYQQMQKTFGFTVIEGNQSIDQVQSMLRRAIMRLLLDV